jgi:glycosyltransferase involved in cell wall biosynthesis
MAGVIFVTWEKHRRTRELARAFGWELHELTSSSRRLFRTPALLYRTGMLLWKRRPCVTVVQCPSVFLAYFAGVLKRRLKYRLVVDLHNAAVESTTRWECHRRLLRAIHRRADLAIVSNDLLRPQVTRSAPAVAVLPDTLPVFSGSDTARVSRQREVLFVCSYAPDEPYMEVIEAARLLPPDVTINVTGNPCGHLREAEVPANVRLLGFVPDDQYERLLSSADVVVDLTTRQDCLVCGAYEAVSAGVPLVTSDTPALRAYFRKGCVHSGHAPEQLATSILKALREGDTLRGELERLRRELASEWRELRVVVDSFVTEASRPCRENGR